MSFTDDVHSIVRQIPPGSVLSYQAVAAAAGKPAAARAVANIMAKNFDSTIPCHRVIRSDGTVGGYNRGGSAEKERKLLSEGWVPRTMSVLD